MQSNAKQIVITKLHTKFELTSSKRLKLPNFEKQTKIWISLQTEMFQQLSSFICFKVMIKNIISVQVPIWQGGENPY